MLELSNKRSFYVLVGNYEYIIDQLLLSNIKNVTMVPRVLWIDYRIIPVDKISKNFKTSGLRSLNDIFFIEIESLEILGKLIRSGELEKATKHTFRTIIINLPTYSSFDVETLNALDRVARQTKVILLTKKSIIKTLSSVILEVSEE